MRLTRRRIHGCCTVLMAVFLGAPAVAQSEPAGRTHDGFQLRLGLGGGFLRDEMEATFFSDASGTAEGGSIAFQGSFGFAVGEGIFLGGGFFSDTVRDPEITFEDEPAAESIEIGSLMLTGVYLDYFLDDNWHLYGALGAANIRTKDEDGEVDAETAAGGGLVAGGGYDAWVADDFTIGGAARITTAGLWGDFVGHSVTAMSLLVTGTYD